MNTKNTQITAAEVTRLTSTRSQSIGRDAAPGLVSENPRSPIQNPTSSHGEPFVFLADVAAHLGISPRSVQKRMREGLPFHKWGRSLRFLLSEVDAYARTSTFRVDTGRKKVDNRDIVSLSGRSPEMTITKAASAQKTQ